MNAKFKKTKRSSGLAVDGIVRPERSPRGSYQEGKIRRTRTYRPEEVPRRRKSKVGDFRQPTLSSITDGATPLGKQPERRTIGDDWDDSTFNNLAEDDVSTKESKKRRFWPFKKKKNKQPLTKRQKIKRGALIGGGVVMLLGLIFLGIAWWNARQILPGGGGSPALEDCADLSQLKVEGDCRVNVMLLGRGGGTHTAPNLTDTIIIASIDPIHDEAALVSIPRDLYVQPEGEYGYTKINAVYANNKTAALSRGESRKKANQIGIKSTQDVLEDKLGIPIHYYAMVDFQGFQEAIDTVGGITIDVKEQLYDPSVAWENDWDPLIADVGEQKFDGQKALLYARSRQTSVRGDFDRAVRQREVMVALKDKVLSAGTYSNPLKVTQLINAFGHHIMTNFSIEEIMKLYGIGKDTQSEKIKSIGLSDPPNNYLTTGTYDGQSVVVPAAGLDNYGEIRAFLRKTLVDPFIRQEKANVLVLNGTTTEGLGTNTVKLLRSFGYKVKKAEDAPTRNYQKTILIDVSDEDNKYTRHYLERRFKVSAESRLPDKAIQPGEDIDFVIILGQDEAEAN